MCFAGIICVVIADDPERQAVGDGQVLRFGVLLCSFDELYLLIPCGVIVFPVIFGICPDLHIVGYASQPGIIIHHAVILCHPVEYPIDGGLITVLIQPGLFTGQQVDLHVSGVGIPDKGFHHIHAVYQFVCTDGVVDLGNAVELHGIQELALCVGVVINAVERRLFAFPIPGGAVHACLFCDGINIRRAGIVQVFCVTGQTQRLIADQIKPVNGVVQGTFHLGFNGTL